MQKTAVERMKNLCRVRWCVTHLPHKTLLTTFFTGHHLPATASTRCFTVFDLRHAAASPFSANISANTSRCGLFAFEQKSIGFAHDACSNSVSVGLRSLTPSRSATPFSVWTKNMEMLVLNPTNTLNTHHTQYNTTIHQ